MPVRFFSYTLAATLRGPKRRQAAFGNIRFPKADADPGFGPQFNCPKRCFSQRFWAFSFPEENFRSWNHGGRRPSSPAGTDGIGTVRPWAPALGSPGRPNTPDPSSVPFVPRRDDGAAVPLSPVRGPNGTLSGESIRDGRQRQPED